MRAGPLKAGHPFVALGNLLLDAEMQIGKRAPHPAETSCKRANPRPCSGNGTCSTTSSQTN